MLPQTCAVQIGSLHTSPVMTIYCTWHAHKYITILRSKHANVQQEALTERHQQGWLYIYSDYVHYQFSAITTIYGRIYHF